MLDTSRRGTMVDHHHNLLNSSASGNCSTHNTSLNTSVSGCNTSQTMMISNHKQGYLMYYDQLQGQWQRVYVQLGSETLSLYSNSSKFGRLVMPTIHVVRIKKIFSTIGADGICFGSASATNTPNSSAANSRECSPHRGTPPGDKEDAQPDSRAASPRRVPSNHRTIIGIRTDDNLIVFRTPEPKSLINWMEAFQSLDSLKHVAYQPVSAMGTLRGFFTPQLFAQLFRGEDGTRHNRSGVVGSTKSRMPEVPKTVADMRGGGRGGRIASISADGAQRRLPARRAMPIVTARNLLPANDATSALANSPPPTNKSSPKKAAAMAASAEVLSRPRVNMTNKSPSPDHRKPFIAGGKTPTNKEHADPNESGLVRSHTSPTLPSPIKHSSPEKKEKEAPTPIKRPSVSPMRNASPSPVSPARNFEKPSKSPSAARRVFGQEAPVNTSSSPNRNTLQQQQEDAPLAATGRSLGESFAPLPAASDKAAQLAEAKREMEELRASNFNLELDNMNMSARILELEGETESFRAGIAEWRRRYQSLEGQLKVQEQDFENRLRSEKESVIANVQEEVKEQLEQMRDRWMARESEYQLEIEQLKAQLAAK